MDIRNAGVLLALAVGVCLGTPLQAEDAKPTVDEVNAAYAGQSFTTKNRETGRPVIFYYLANGELEVEFGTPDGTRFGKGKWWVEPDSRICVETKRGGNCHPTVRVGDKVFAVNAQNGRRFRPMPIRSGGAPETIKRTKPTPEQIVAAYTGKTYAVKNIPNRPRTTYHYRSGGVVDIETEVPNGMNYQKGKWWVEADSRFCIATGAGTVCQETILAGDTVFAINAKTGSKIRPMRIPN